MKAQEKKLLAKLTVKELHLKLRELRNGYMLMAKNKLRSTEKNKHVGRVVKKDIANVLTALKQKEIGL